MPRAQAASASGSGTRSSASIESMPQMPQPVRPASVLRFSFRRAKQRLVMVISTWMPGDSIPSPHAGAAAAASMP
ncbi:hypothetical protein D3C72_1643750 [compost metagenome]